MWQEKSSCLVLLEVNLLLSIFAFFKHKNELKILVCSEKTCESWAVIAKVTSTFTQIHKTSSQRFGAVHTPARFVLSSQFRHQFSCCITAYGAFPSHTHTHKHVNLPATPSPPDCEQHKRPGAACHVSGLRLNIHEEPPLTIARGSLTRAEFHQTHFSVRARDSNSSD